MRINTLYISTSAYTTKRQVSKTIDFIFLLSISYQVDTRANASAPTKVVMVTVFDARVGRGRHGSDVMKETLGNELFGFRIHLRVQVHAMHVANQRSTLWNVVSANFH